MSETNPYQELLEQLHACDNQEERDWLSLRFSIAQLPKELQAAVRAAAVPRFFDCTFLNALLDQPLDEAQFAELLEQPYIEPYPGEGRYNVHERSRKLLQEKLWQEDEALYREISRRAFVYCKAQDQEDITWRIETIYHQLIVEPEKGASVLNRTCVDWINPPYFAYEKIESLLRAVQEHQLMDRLEVRAENYFWYFQSQRYIRCSFYQEAIQSLNHISVAAIQDDPFFMGNYHSALGKLKLMMSNFQVAQIDFETALLKYREINNRIGEANTLFYLGEIKSRFSEFSEAINSYEAAFLLYSEEGTLQGQANCFFSLGNIYIQYSNFPEALQQYKNALNLYRKTSNEQGAANCLSSIGKIHIYLSDFVAARQCYEKSFFLYKKTNNLAGQIGCLFGFCQVHLGNCNLSQAQACCNDVLIKYQEINDQLGEANAFHLLGKIKRYLSQFMDAQANYKAALHLYEQIGHPQGVVKCLEGFAKLHQAQGQLQQAEEYWQKAAGKYNELSMPLRAEQCLEQLRKLKEQ